MTMKTPEMEVVRFSESDVIVASGNLALQNMNDSIAKNAIITVGGQTHTVESYKNLLDSVSGQSNVKFKKDNYTVALDNLSEEEEHNTITDGFYSKIITDSETIWTWLRGFDNQ